MKKGKKKFLMKHPMRKFCNSLILDEKRKEEILDKKEIEKFLIKKEITNPLFPYPHWKIPCQPSIPPPRQG